MVFTVGPLLLLLLLAASVIWVRRHCLARQKAAQARSQQHGDVSLQKLDESPGRQRKPNSPLYHGVDGISGGIREGYSCVMPMTYNYRVYGTSTSPCKYNGTAMEFGRCRSSSPADSDTQTVECPYASPSSYASAAGLRQASYSPPSYQLVRPNSIGHINKSSVSATV